MTRRDDEQRRLDNGLHAPTYVPLTDVDATVGQHLLTALGRARIAAYLCDTPAGAGAGPGIETRTANDAPAADTTRRRLFVASDERADARTIVAAAVRALGTPAGEAPALRDEPADADTDAAFDALVAGWRVDTVAAVRDAERDLTREDADWRARLGRAQASDEVWLDEDHYVPPPPPPLPRLAGPTIIGMFVMVVAILVLALGGYVGLAGEVSLVMGIGGLVAAAGIFFTRIRDQHRDDDDDGSAV